MWLCCKLRSTVWIWLVKLILNLFVRNNKLSQRLPSNRGPFIAPKISCIIHRICDTLGESMSRQTHIIFLADAKENDMPKTGHCRRQFSMPVYPCFICLIHAGVAELADALDLGSSGRPCRFKSCHPH